jgi:hypothetical protein
LAAVVGRISFFVNAGIRFVDRDLQDARLHRAVGRASAANATA